MVCVERVEVGGKGRRGRQGRREKDSKIETEKRKKGTKYKEI